MRLLLPVFLSLTLLAAADPFTVGPVSSKEVGPGLLEVHVSTTCNQALPWAPKVPVPFALLTMTGPIKFHAIEELDMLGSFYQTDLDTDEDWTQMSVTDREGVLRIDQLAVEPLASGVGAAEHPFQSDGSPKLYRLSPSGPTFQVLFFQDPTIGINLQHRMHEPKILQAPNPCLEIRVLETCTGLSNPSDVPGDPNFTLSFSGPVQQNLQYCWEPWVFQSLGRMPRWLRGQYMTLPLSGRPGTEEQVFRVQCARTDTTLALTAQVSYTTDPQVHLRSRPVVGLLRSPAGAQ